MNSQKAASSNTQSLINGTLVRLIHRWGNASSEVLLEFSAEQFTLAGVEGCIGYLQEPGFAVVVGDPICRKEDSFRLAEAFHSHCKKQRLEVIYLLVSATFAEWAANGFCRISMEVGEEFSFDPQQDITQGHDASKLRNYIHHAEHLGARVEEYINPDPDLELEMKELCNSWLEKRKGLQVYLADLDLFKDRANKRWFYIRLHGQLKALALLSKLEAKQGWLLKFFIVDQNAPRGVSELLMVSILKYLREENCRFLTYGVVPSKSLGEVRGLDRFPAQFIRLFFKVFSWIFHLQKRQAYWHKYQPKKEPVYVLFTSKSVAYKEIKAILKALKFNR